MSQPIVSNSDPVLIVGGADVDKDQFAQALTKCSVVVAADGGADTVLGLGRTPDKVIGDLDSIRPETLAHLDPAQVHRITEQDSTDFDKCLRSVSAPFVIGLGFLGARLDHTLAALTVLARHPDRRCLLLDRTDVVMLAPPDLRLSLPPGCRVSLYPMARVTGRSQGLHWPIDTITFAPDTVTGTSNHTDTGDVRLKFDMPGMLLILPALQVTQLCHGLAQATGSWPVRV